MSQLKTNLLKATLSAVLLGAVALPQAAMAQVGVYDADAVSVLRDIESNTDATQEDTNDIHQFQEDETKPHYDEELKRLNKMIRSMSYRDPEADGIDAYSGEVDASIFDLLDSDARRQSRVDAYEKTRDGSGELYGVLIDGAGGGGGGLPGGGGGGGSLSDYYSQYGLVDPSEIYAENETMRNKLAALHSALYYAEATSGEIDAGREGRVQAYDELIEKAKASKDVMTSMEINNALLIENGRNLALLINLQTAALNAQSVDLRDKAHAEQRLKSTFGESGGVDSALTGLLTQVVF